MTTKQIKPKDFLFWLKARLQNKYHEDKEILDLIDQMINRFCFFPKKVPIGFIDKICKKYYCDFDLDDCELSIGYTNKDRDQIRSFILGILIEGCNFDK